MLSTVNQHKSSMKTESVRSITLVSKAASRFSLRKIPEFVYSALPISIALSMGLVLVGCGAGNNPTTRTNPTPPPSSTVRTSYNLTIQSPVLLKNIKVTVSDTTSGAVIVQSTIQNSNEAVVEIPVAFLKTDNVLMITLSPIDSASKYFDPMTNGELGAIADFNQSLHSLVSMNSSDKITRVDPFSEIIYQRTLIRTGTLDISKPQINRLNTTQLNAATSEMTTSFGVVAGTPYSILFNSPTSIAAINVYNDVLVVNTQANNALLAIGQLALYAQNNPADPAPYLNFAARASLDLRDGDLDGMSIFGGDTAGTVRITNPILYTGIISDPNNDPDFTDTTSLIAINKNQRIQQGAVLKLATTTYFSTIDASLPLASRTSSSSLDYIQNYDYGIFAQSYVGTGFGSTPTEPSYRIGAGNFTRAFGLPTLTDSKQAIDASDGGGRSHDIMQLNGTYQSSNGCQLSVGYDGTIQLSQGTQTYQAIVSRKFSDRLIRLSGDHYLVNVTSADLTAPRFIQIRTIGAQVISADAGRSTNQVPTTLDTTELHCDF